MAFTLEVGGCGFSACNTSQCQLAVAELTYCQVISLYFLKASFEITWHSKDCTLLVHRAATYPHQPCWESQSQTHIIHRSP